MPRNARRHSAESRRAESHHDADAPGGVDSLAIPWVCQSPDRHLLTLALSVSGVEDAQLCATVTGERRLALDVADGFDAHLVAAHVEQLLDQKLGIRVQSAETIDDIKNWHGSLSRPVPLGAQEPGPHRVLLERVSVATSELESTVEVSLAVGPAHVLGAASGATSERAILSLAASATLNAVEQLLAGRCRCAMEYADVLHIGSDRLAVVLVSLTLPTDTDRLSGAALVRGDAGHAVARATLAALNRRLDLALGSPPWQETGVASVTSAISVRGLPLELDAGESEPVNAENAVEVD